MKLKTLTKHLLMQWPTLFRNALDVYNHLFYVVGNGYEWKNGILVQSGFRTKTKMQCIKEYVNESFDYVKRMQKEFIELTNDFNKEHMENVRIKHYKTSIQNILNGIELIENADIHSDDFRMREGFMFYPIYEGYSKCTTIPDDIQPDWLEGINKINKIKEEYEKSRQSEIDKENRKKEIMKKHEEIKEKREEI